jgi:hypothetical protein
MMEDRDFFEKAAFCKPGTILSTHSQSALIGLDACGGTSPYSSMAVHKTDHKSGELYGLQILVEWTLAGWECSTAQSLKKKGGDHIYRLLLYANLQ